MMSRFPVGYVSGDELLLLLCLLASLLHDVEHLLQMPAGAYGIVGQLLAFKVRVSNLKEFDDALLEDMNGYGARHFFSGG